MKSKKLAEVPYDIEKSYDFYDNQLVVDNRTIKYSDIQGYGYHFAHNSNSINFIPVSNSTVFTVYLDLGDEIFQFGRYANGPMAFKGHKQKTIDLIFSEVYKCLEILVSPFVIENVRSISNLYGEIQIGGLTITSSEIIKKSFRGTKSLALSEYQETVTNKGSTTIFATNGKPFYTCSLTVINAPIIGRILDQLAGIQ